MDLKSAKKYLEKEGKIASMVGGLPPKFLEPFIMNGLRVDSVEPGRIICSMKIPTRLLSIISDFKNSGDSLHGGATATLVDLVGSAAIYTVGANHVGVSVEISVSYLDAAYADEEIEIEGRTLRVGKAVGVAIVEFRKKKTGKIFAQGRHTKYLALASKM